MVRDPVQGKEAAVISRRSPLRRFLRSFGGIVGLVVLVAVVAAAVAAPRMAPTDPTRPHITQRLKPPAWAEGGNSDFLLGTDHLGRDIASRILWGARISLLVGFLAVAISGTIGVAIGLISGYFGGWLDRVVMRICDIQLSMPFVLLAIAVVAVLGRGLGNLVAALSVTGWVAYARIVRAQVLVLREREFLESARALGAGHFRMLLLHILPNVAPSVIVVASLSVAQMIILESALSFLGLGVPPPTPTWGGMLADSRDYLTTAGWIATFPGLAILVTVLSINLVGDALRDALDPRVQI